MSRYHAYYWQYMDVGVLRIVFGNSRIHLQEFIATNKSI
jgi:hypothetical protein